jgi:hypothetical protein
VCASVNVGMKPLIADSLYVSVQLSMLYTTHANIRVSLYYLLFLALLLMSYDRLCRVCLKHVDVD